MKINFNGRKIDVKVKKVSFLGMGIGLTFRTSKTKNLLFAFGSSGVRSITSFFVFFPFLAVYLNGKNSVVDFKLVKPFTPIVSPAKPFTKLLEIPLNKRNAKLTKFFVDKRKI